MLWSRRPTGAAALSTHGTGSKLSDYYGSIGLNPVGHDVSSAERYARHFEKRRSLLEHHLGLPLLLWRGARVLEFGPGSGENALVLARLGARLTLVEPLDYLAAELRRKLSAHPEQVEDVQVSVLERFAGQGAWDVVVAEGFVHFLDDVPAALARLGSFVAPFGFLMLSVLEPVGTFLELAKKLYLNRGVRACGLDDAGRDALARALFLPEFERLNHSRGFQSWVGDCILNPLYRARSCVDVVACLEALPEFRLHASWPNYLDRDDLVWHKDVKPLARLRDEARRGYYARCPHFLHSVPTPPGELRLVEPDAGRRFAADYRAALGRLDAWLDARDPGPDALCAALNDILAALDHPALARARETVAAVRDLFLATREAGAPAAFVEAWRAAELVRTRWGSPGHYFVLQRG